MLCQFATNSKSQHQHRAEQLLASSSSAVRRTPKPQRALEEVVPLSLQNGSAPAVALGLLINTNLETSVANAFMPLPVPVPNNVVVEHPHPRTADGVEEVDGNKTDASVRTANSVSVEELVRGNNQENEEKGEDPKLSESKALSLVLETETVSKIEISEKADQVMASMEECPTCLEEYDDDNPKIITECKHHFHLACILEWMERSDSCPVCNKEMKFSSLTNQ